MSGTPVAEYPIRARIVVGRVDASGATPGLDKLDEKTKRIADNGRGIGTAIAAGMAVAAAALGIGVTKAVTLGMEMETAQGNIASLLMSMADLDAVNAQKMGKTIIQQLSEDAAKGAGELQNYVDAYQGIFTPARQGGASMAQIRELTRLTLAAGFGLQGQRGLINAPLDIQQALTSGAHDRTTPIVMAALRASGVSGEEFNKASKGDQLSMLMAGFKHFEGAAALMGQTVEAQASTLSDSLKRLYRDASAPIFEGFKRGLTSVNETLSANDAQLDTFTDGLAQASEGLGTFIAKIMQGGADLAVGATKAAPSVNASAGAWNKLFDTFGGGGPVQGIGETATEAVSGLSYFTATLAYTTRMMWQEDMGVLDAISAVRQAQEDQNNLYTYYPGSGYQKNTQSYLDQNGTPLYMLGPETVGTGDMLQVDPAFMLAGVKALEQEQKKSKGRERKITVELKTARIEWGNDRSLALALKPAMATIADRMTRAGTESSMGVDLGD